MDRTEESVHKVGLVRQRLAAAGLDALVLRSHANFAWITAGGTNHVQTSEEPGVAEILITPDRAAVVASNIEVGRMVEEQLAPGCFEVLGYPWRLPGRREQLLLGVVGKGTLADDRPAQQNAAGRALEELRRTLTPEEAERYRILAQDAALAVESACRSIKRHDSELDVAARVAELCLSKGILPVVNLAAADERIARFRHPLPTANRVDRTMLVALTARRHGLHASLTRTMCFGKPDPEQEHRHRTCARIDARMIQASRPGRSLGAVLAEGIDQYSAQGYPDEWQHHHQGGLTGYAGREILANPGSEYLLKENQALTWNPSVAGAKSEDTIFIGSSGAEVLTATGHWPEIEVEVEGVIVKRPGLLTR